MKLHTFFGVFAAALLLCLGNAQDAAAGTLRVGSPAMSGEQVVVPIMLEGDVGQGVAALDFRLNYDPAVLEPVAVHTGNAARSSGKQVHANKRVDGEYAVVMVGLNQNTLQGGEVAQVIFRRSENAQGSTNLSITQTAFASPEASEISSSGSTAALDLGSGRVEDVETPRDESSQPGRRTNDRQQNEADNSRQTAASAGGGSAASPGRQASAAAGQNRTAAPFQMRPRATPSPEPSDATPQAGRSEELRRIASTMRDIDDTRAAIQQRADSAQPGGNSSASEGVVTPGGPPRGGTRSPSGVEATGSALTGTSGSMQTDERLASAAPGAQRQAIGGGPAISDGAGAAASAENRAQSAGGIRNNKLALAVALLSVGLAGFIFLRRRMFA